MRSDGCTRRARHCLLQQCFWMSSRRLSTFAPVIMATCDPGHSSTRWAGPTSRRSWLGTGMLWVSRSLQCSRATYNCKGKQV
jgi:hypothetical protein